MIRRRLTGVALAILPSMALLMGSAVAQEKAAEPEPYKPVTWKNGLQYRSEDGNVQFRLGGYLQADGWFFLDDQDNLETDSFFIRRARIIMEAAFWKRFEFRFMPDFSRGSTSIYDAYIDIRFNEAFKLRMGKMKTPVGLERLQSAPNITMVERALPTNLVPIRDIGLMAQGTFSHDTLSYMAGVFNGVPDGSNADLDTNDGKDGEARIFALPFRNSISPRLQGLGFGVGGSFGNSQGTLPVYRTAGLTQFFQYLTTSTADGRRARFNPCAYYYTGPFGFMAEFVESKQGVSDGVTQDDMHNRAYMFTTMWVVSNGTSSFEGVTAEHPMGPKEGGRGALQLALRYSALRVDDAAFPLYADPDAAARRAGAWGLGVNWILNYNVRLSFQYEWTKFLGGAAAGASREDENAALLQLQFRL
ncbi:MAG: OprO/OprP family phosphate-selective porin [Acidobacteria bacterium]|nr:OprO/OprP family phosphate-selective porin [Acidobacteriota bacterium]